MPNLHSWSHSACGSCEWRGSWCGYDCLLYPNCMKLKMLELGLVVRVVGAVLLVVVVVLLLLLLLLLFPSSSSSSFSFSFFFFFFLLLLPSSSSFFLWLSLLRLLWSLWLWLFVVVVVVAVVVVVVFALRFLAISNTEAARPITKGRTMWREARHAAELKSSEPPTNINQEQYESSIFLYHFSRALPLPFHISLQLLHFLLISVSMRSLGSEFSPLTLHETWRDLHHELCIALLCRSWIKWCVGFRLVQVHKSYAHRWNSHLDAARQTRCVIGRYPMRWRLRTFAKEFRGKQQAVCVS